MKILSITHLHPNVYDLNIEMVLVIFFHPVMKNRDWRFQASEKINNKKKSGHKCSILFSLTCSLEFMKAAMSDLCVCVWSSDHKYVVRRLFSFHYNITVYNDCNYFVSNQLHIY